MEARTRPLQRSRALLGLLAVAATLVLASPGVDVVRAGDEVPAASSEAPQCSAGRAPTDNAEIQAILEQLRREEMARIADGEDHPIVLNGRGYNYGPAPSLDLDRIRAEAARDRQD